MLIVNSIMIISALLSGFLSIYQFMNRELYLGLLSLIVFALTACLAFLLIRESMSKKPQVAKTTSRPAIQSDVPMSPPVSAPENEADNTAAKAITSPKVKDSRNTMLLVSLVLSLAYVSYLIWYVWDMNSQSSGNPSYDLGIALGTALLYPHLIATIMALVFNTIAWFFNIPWSALVSGILYIISMAMMPVYFFFVIIQAILSFAGYVQVRKYKNM